MKTAVAAVAIAGLVVVGTDALTYAGTGDSLILGKVNESGRTTHVTSTGTGPALSLHTGGKGPALAVDSDAKVMGLNADRVDGLEAAGLQNNVHVYTATEGQSSADGYLVFQVADVPSGHYEASYSVSLNGLDGTASNPSTARCYFTTTGGAEQAGLTTSTNPSYTSIGLNAAGVAIELNGAPLELGCSAFKTGVGPDVWHIPASHPVRVTLTKIDRTIANDLSIESGARQSTS